MIITFIAICYIISIIGLFLKKKLSHKWIRSLIIIHLVLVLLLIIVCFIPGIGYGVIVGFYGPIEYSMGDNTTVLYSNDDIRIQQAYPGFGMTVLSTELIKYDGVFEKSFVFSVTPDRIDSIRLTKKENNLTRIYIFHDGGYKYISNPIDTVLNFSIKSDILINPEESPTSANNR